MPCTYPPLLWAHMCRDEVVTIDTGASVPDWEDVVVARKSGVPALRHAGRGWAPGLAGGCCAGWRLAACGCCASGRTDAQIDPRLGDCQNLLHSTCMAVLLCAAAPIQASCASPFTPSPRSQLEQQRMQEYLAALEQALQMGTIDEAEFEEVGGQGGLLLGVSSMGRGASLSRQPSAIGMSLTRRWAQLNVAHWLDRPAT